jgi:hypothetical protein
MKKMLFSLLPAIFIWLGSCCIATAEDSGVAQSDQITQGQQIIQDDNSTTGKFQPVAVDSFTTSDVALQFPTSLANKSVIVQALDGGTLGIDGSSATIGADGSLGFSFQVTDQPGVYRVVVIDPNATEDTTPVLGVVQFEVPPPAE